MLGDDLAGQINDEVLADLNGSRAFRGVDIEIVQLDRLAREVRDDPTAFGFYADLQAFPVVTDPDDPTAVGLDPMGFDADQFVRDVEAVYKRIGRCVVAVSEGIHDADGAPMAAKLAEMQGHHVERDAHGNVQLSGSGALADFLAQAVKDYMGRKTRVRADTYGYLQRSFAGVVSENDAIEARAAGFKAAELATSGLRSGSVAIQRKPVEGYEIEYNRIELADVAAKTRHLPKDWIVGGNDISDKFVEYAAPIVGDLPVVERVDGW